MLYCPEGISLIQIWLNHGISECFAATLSSYLLGVYILLFGTMQVWMYKRYGTLASAPLHQSTLYYLQFFLCFLLSALALSRFLLQVLLLNPGAIYGYMLIWTSVSVLIYPYSAVLIWLECNYHLPSVPPKGHGIILLVFWTLNFITENLTLLNLARHDWWFHPTKLSDKIEMALFVGRYVTCLLLFVLGLRAPGITTRDYFNAHEYTNRILPPNRSNSQRSSSWLGNAYHHMSVLLPFLWPKKSTVLQIKLIICILLLFIARIINVFVPLYSKYIVDSLKTVPLTFRWDLVVTFVGMKFLQGQGTGGMGLLNNLRSYLWLAIQQYTSREVQVSLFAHLHSLSLNWHLKRKTGEVLRIMDRGTDSINSLLSSLFFSIIPTLIDIIIAVIFFATFFNSWFGAIVFTTMALYLAFTVIITEWRTKFQRSMNLADNACKGRSVDSLLNFETVKYYGAEAYEVEAYRESILQYQEEEWKSVVSLQLLNTLQNTVISGGLLVGSLFCVYLVTIKQELTAGDYVLFASYLIQLYVPLNWFGTYYRVIQKNFVDMENMLDLLSEEAEILDAPGAMPLAITKGAVEFRNVSFAYTEERLILRNISFTVPPGKTVALVGPSGSGKSTIIRLLFRFYDVDQGAILVDGQNTKTVRQSSLRRAIGVVPQDTVLFNNTIKFNIQYGRVAAPDADIIEAARSADIHERILTFPEGYNTQVGERGLKLSGGEKQRVAIARTILKSPIVVLLDEATSALDTQTERNIQSALSRVCANRTTIIVAHRLSTIIHADEILVLKDGEIVERGRHEELLNFGGMYHSMWEAQLKNDDIQADSDQVNAAGDTDQS
ncbi:ATP-binding cassette sub-family B member 6, mitochondrial [Nilaparvata lugens]|uniref:ATP-binding cassette sub-family B member 6, mitochondrial n=1 Tax=Nilaparvata lugens TaxID=108931 RepID=UPI00193D3BA7|nr:ATP-binding cassette sub-family B member 6, mitochondrial [Nilaparvata lugens]